jgi:hypothetical protein
MTNEDLETERMFGTEPAQNISPLSCLTFSEGELAAVVLRV